MTNDERVRSISVTRGQKPRLCAISSSRLPITSTRISTPLHTLPPPPPYVIFMPRPMMSAYGQYWSLGVKNVASMRSRVPGSPPPQRTYQHHPIHSLHLLHMLVSCHDQ